MIRNEVAGGRGCWCGCKGGGGKCWYDCKGCGCRGEGIGVVKVDEGWCGRRWRDEEGMQ